MHDAVTLEDAGIPTAVIIEDGFKELAESKRRQMGLQALHPIIIPGMMSSRVEARDMADNAYATVVNWLKLGGMSGEPLESSQKTDSRAARA